MEQNKDSKHLAAQHSKAQEYLLGIHEPMRQYLKSMLDLQETRNATYLQFVAELKQLENRYEDQYNALYSQRAELLKCYHGFWLNAIKNNSLCSSMVYPKDEQLLYYLIDIKLITDPDSDNFVLEFYFDSNSYIENDVLRKKYIMTNTDVMEKAIGYEIKWKNENLTQEVILDDQGLPKDLKKAESFFSFFNSISLPTPAELENMDEESKQDLIETFENDFDIASEFKDEIIPNAILYYFSTKSDLEDT
jgi:Nucleosome assembly protein (NAP)